MRQLTVLDAPDLSAESSFWSAVLGGTVGEFEDWHMVYVDDEPRLGIQHAPNHVPPEWPNGTQQQQIHLDLWVRDVNAAHDQVMSLGATVLDPADLDKDSGFQVYADPAGHPFCLCWKQWDA